MNIINVGLIGAGTVGQGVAQLVRKNSNIIFEKTGVRINLQKVCDLDQRRQQVLNVDKNIFTKNANDILNDPAIHIIVELIGGTSQAREYILEAIKKGKHVVTANKALLSQKGDEIFQAAYKRNIFIGFEASVAGGVPIIKVIRESLIANKIKNIFGIVNGTTNFILTKMEENALEFSDALKLAQHLGFAEANPVFDIKGIDAAHKLQILASFAFNTPVEFKKIYYEGIDRIDLADIVYISDLGYRLKLLAIAKFDKASRTYECHVNPTLIHRSSPLAAIKNEYNAILIDGDATGSQIFYGKGAGALPTASAILADIVEISKKIINNESKFYDRFYSHQSHIKMKDYRDTKSRYYLRFGTIDKPGVLAKVSGILGKNNISLCSVLQKETGQKVVPIVMLTHESKEADIQDAIKAIQKLDVVKEKPKVLRIEDTI
ncbi:MAG: homoserine dehydrogenase [Spirochaetes bacterium]|nr:homoserine dehydrogenase [Spirochaetota bacterium]